MNSEQILNWVIPAIAILVIFFLLYRNKKIKEAVDLLFDKISQLLGYTSSKVSESIAGTTQKSQEIVYG